MQIKRRSLVALFVLCFALMTPGNVIAEGPSMAATGGFDGYYKQGEWFPITVTLTNDGKDLDGVVRVTLPSSGTEANFQREVQLPARSKKTIRLYARTEDYLKNIEAVLVAGGKSVASVPLTMRAVGPRDQLIAAVGDRGDLGFLTRSTGLVRELAKVSLTDLPDNSLGFSSVDVLVLNGAPTGELSEGQRQALADWIGAGGQLIVGTGVDWQRAVEGLNPILPAELTSLVSLNKITGIEDLGLAPMESSGSFAAAKMVPKANGRVIAGEETTPLVVEGPVGLGTVTVVGIDLASDPLRGWAGNEQFWSTLLAPQEPSLTFGPPQSRISGNALSGALYNLPALDLPSAWWLALFLFIYAAVIGPVNYLILRRLDKREWAWVTVPVITLVFAFATYALGLGAKGGDVVLNSVSIIQVPADGQKARAETYFGLFSPSQRGYDVDLTGATLVAPLAQGGLPGSGNADITEGATVQIRHFNVNAWSMRSFVARSVTEVPIQIQTNLAFKNDHLEGTIVHKSGPALDDATVFIGSNVVKLGAFGAGETKSVSLSTPYNPLKGSYPLANALYYAGPAGYSRDMARKQALTEAAFGVDGIVGNQLGLAGAYLIGWMANNPLDVRISGQKVREEATSLIVFPLSVQGDQRSFVMPPGMARRKIMATGSTLLEYSPGGLSIRGGPALVNFQLPAYANSSTVKQMDLICYAMDKTPNRPPFEVSLYNWRDRVWVPQAGLVNGKNEVRDPAQFVNERGLVEAMVTVDGNESGIDLDIGVRGGRP